jgi:type IV pilus assembly protein PilV
MIMRHMHLPERRQGGFSLVEALVALVVLSVGMLGIAALYVESLRSGRTALLRTQAVTLAADMADRIRANRSGGIAYEAIVTSANTNAACAPLGAGCTPAALASHDKAVWLGAIEFALPGGTGTIDFDGTTTPATYTITISWTEAGQGWTEAGQATASGYASRIQA